MKKKKQKHKIFGIFPLFFSVFFSFPLSQFLVADVIIIGGWELGDLSISCCCYQSGIAGDWYGEAWEKIRGRWLYFAWINNVWRRELMLGCWWWRLEASGLLLLLFSLLAESWGVTTPIFYILFCDTLEIFRKFFFWYTGSTKISTKISAESPLYWEVPSYRHIPCLHF